MVDDKADETMDSLLKEIDDEMENTIHLESNNLKHGSAEKKSRRWSIPLQEIGDETMEMLVSHNTIRNIQIKEAAEFDKRESTPLLPTRKSVVFSDGVNLHEYANGSDDEHLDSDQASVKIDTRWKKSSFVPSAEVPDEVNQSLVVETHSDTDEEPIDRNLDLTSEDLLEHSVTNLDQKLSHMFDANRNAHRLKLVTEEMEEEESIPVEEPSKIKYTLQPTKPLTVGAPANVEEASLIHFQTDDMVDVGYEEDEDADSSSEFMNEVRHSPSKIPLTNTVNINNFSMSQQGIDPQTRLSSGSSCCDSVADLKTTIQHDRYKLLDSSNDPPVQRGTEYLSDSEPFLHRELIATHPNSSRIFSVATSGDGYRSAKETAYSVCSVSSNGDVCGSPITKSAEGSVEDLDISAGLRKEEDTTLKTDQELQSDTGNVPSDKGPSELSPNKSQAHPQIPQLPMMNLRLKEVQPVDTSREKIETTERYESLRTSDVSDIKAISPHPNKEQSNKELAEGSNSEKAPELPVTNMDLKRQASLSSRGSFTEQLSDREPSSEINVHEAVPVAQPQPQDPSAGSDKECFETNVDDIAKVGDHIETQSPLLPRVARMESLFQDDPFVDEFDTSAESIDLTRSVKPSNYLSIWHMQEEDIKSTSPALSSNSQFSRYTNSTDTSAPNSNLERAFKFKPRVISRSKYYYPESRYSSTNSNDDYVITKAESALDPLRRNTLISKKIQENLRIQRSFFPAAQSPDETRDAEEGQDEAKLSDTVDQTLTENTEIIQPTDAISDEQLQNCELQSLPSLPDVELEQEFHTFLEAVTADNRSLFHQPNDERGGYNVWEEDYNLDTPATPAKDTVSIDVIHRLLDDENKTGEPLEADSRSSGPTNIVGMLKTPVKEVAVGRGLSLKGYEAMVSEGFGSEGYSKGSIKQVGDDIMKTPPMSPSPSPIKKTHVGSPFKVMAKTNVSSQEMLQTAEQTVPQSEESLGINEKDELKDLQENQSGLTETLADDNKQDTPLADRGNLYLQLKDIKNLLLHNVEHHKAEFAVEFDNGMDTVQTAWQSLASSKTCEIDKEFEVILANDMNKTHKLIITLKCRYQSPEYGLEEVIEKVPVGRKFPFSKSKFEYQKRYVQKATKQDEWDFLFARDGSFGRCEISLDDSFLAGIKFRNVPLAFTMMNEWARKLDPSSSKKLHELPRKSPYAVGTLNVQACYLERTSPLEKFPKTLEIARNIISRYKQQQAIFKEGFMLQEGGDVQNSMQRRFFRLQGNNMLGYHEYTRQPKLAVNLLKVVKVFGPGDIPKEGERNLTDLVLFSGCFHLVFDNEEKITFSTESPQDGEDWCNKISEVVSLNRCHQPWVKYFHQSVDLDH